MKYETVAAPKMRPWRPDSYCRGPLPSQSGASGSVSEQARLPVAMVAPTMKADGWRHSGLLNAAVGVAAASNGGAVAVEAGSMGRRQMRRAASRSTKPPSM